jgi:hypothetical protein
MIRVVLENVLLFLLPTAVYFGYVLLTRRSASSAGDVVNEAPLVWLFVIGALCGRRRALQSAWTAGRRTRPSLHPATHEERPDRAWSAQVAASR